MSPEMDQRAAVVAEALTWLQTPYQHHQAVKGAGVDCIQFLVAVFVNAGVLAEPPVIPPYSEQWYLHHSEELLLAAVAGYCGEITVPPDPAPGDIILYKVGRTFSHAAIITAWPVVAHAVKGVGVTLDDWNAMGTYGFKVKDTKYFSFWSA